MAAMILWHGMIITPSLFKHGQALRSIRGRPGRLFSHFDFYHFIWHVSRQELVTTAYRWLIDDDATCTGHTGKWRIVATTVQHILNFNKIRESDDYFWCFAYRMPRRNTGMVVSYICEVKCKFCMKSRIFSKMKYDGWWFYFKTMDVGSERCWRDAWAVVARFSRKLFRVDDGFYRYFGSTYSREPARKVFIPSARSHRHEVTPGARASLRHATALLSREAKAATARRHFTTAFQSTCDYLIYASPQEYNARLIQYRLPARVWCYERELAWRVS